MLHHLATKVSQVNNSAVDRKLKILTTPTHEMYQTNLSKTGHEFYLMQGKGVKQWNFALRPLPDNTFLYQISYEQIPHDVDFDLILSQERFGGLQLAKQIQQRTGLPIVHIEHVEPQPGWSKRQFEELKSLRADYHVFITTHNKKSWDGKKEDRVIEHGMDLNSFQGYTGVQNFGVSVVNHFATRDIFCGWNLWKEIASQVPIKLIGENPGISMPARTTHELVSQLQEARFFLNTSQLSPVPLSLIEAMCVGLPIVTTKKQEIPNIIQHGYNGFISDDPQELIKYCVELLNNPKLAKKMGDAARKTAETRYNMDRFVNDWNKVLVEAYENAR